MDIDMDIKDTREHAVDIENMETGPEMADDERETELLNTVKEVAILPSRDMVLFPHMVVPWIIEPPHLVKMIDDALVADRTIAVFTEKKQGSESQDDKKHEQSLPDLHDTGTIGLILRMAKNDEGHAKLIIQGVTRAKLQEITATTPYIKARVEPVHDMTPHGPEVQALAVNVRHIFSKILELSPNLPNELINVVMGIEEPGVLADIAISHLNIPVEERQKILDTLDVRERLETALGILSQQLEMLELGHKIQSKVKSQVDKTQKEFFLREQMKAIQKELGNEGGEGLDETEELRKKLKKAKLPEEAMKEAVRELDRLSRMHPSSPEYSVARTYLEWMTELPWNKFTRGRISMQKAERVLNRDHYDLEKIKKRILEYIAVRKLKPDAKGPILCFAGPPGTGKTSLGRSIARALGRKFFRISLGGIRDEAEIRGHRRTYIGAMPGRIIQGIRKTGVRNPVLMLDEIDKLGTDFRGDPASALLEVLDPEQNSTFTDNYLGVEFDISSVIFLATANVMDTIPPPLLDRMEILELSGYTLEEKMEIARRYLFPRQLKENGLTRKNLTLDKRALERIISEYTREAGVRNLERQIAAICRAVAREVASGNTDKITVRTKNLEIYLGKPRYFSETADRSGMPGVATGLAWTPAGGEILFVEATDMPGSGKLTLTGKLGDVMKESAQAALSLIRARADKLGIEEEVFKKRDIHVHVPSGAIPKDGPSAGVALALALISLLTQRPISPDIAMTGEITLRGLVLPVGGVKEKVLAAYSSGIKEILMPARNSRDLEDLPESIREKLKFHFIASIDQAVNIVFDRKDKG